MFYNTWFILLLMAVVVCRRELVKDRVIEIIHLTRREYTAGRVDRKKTLAPGVFTRG